MGVVLTNGTVDSRAACGRMLSRSVKEDDLTFRLYEPNDGSGHTLHVHNGKDHVLIRSRNTSTVVTLCKYVFDVEITSESFLSLLLMSL